MIPEPNAGLWRHYKGGMYVVLGIGSNSENPTQRLVIYRSVETGSIWARPLEMWFEKVLVGDQHVDRFVFCGDHL